ncbi:chitin synthase [Malassezia psittaci]|uniref:chitin synthase n=1 Tax=Malassezia psittaci TaxID=1821823 RepID=A0AAF0FCR9_9BASI|nr:chitin synthase [Malassezia psittaci]
MSDGQTMSQEATSGDLEDELTTRLCHRYYQGIYYTQIQESVLVAVNPFHTPVDVNGEEVLRSYSDAYRDMRYTKSNRDVPPHIYRTASNAYFYMQRTGQDQTLFFLGETASGKSETRRVAMNAIIRLSVALPGKRGARLGKQLPAALYAMECFGNADADENTNASGMALYNELQFSKNGRLVGMKMLNYCLERSRVSPLRSMERPFHVFYMLIAGASAEDRRRWRFDDVPSFRLLTAGGRGAPLSSAQQLTTRYERLQDALDIMGMPSVQRSAMMDILVAILHISNFEFVQDDGRHTAARIVSEEPLYIAASLLGVGASALSNAVTHLTKVVRGDLCTIMLDADGAAENRDALMRMLYSLLFAWLNEFVNQQLSNDQFHAYIGLFDIPGFSNRVHNSLDQFAVNLLADTVHRHMSVSLLERRTVEMEQEGLSHMAPLPIASDEPERLRLLTNFPGGLVHIMDDQTRRRPRKTDETMVMAMQKRWVNHPALQIEASEDARPHAFIVSHFHGDVSYEPYGWLERNDESFALEHVSLLRGADAQSDGTKGLGSSSVFIRNLFKNAAVSTQLPVPDGGDVQATQAGLRPLRAPSIRRAERQGTLRGAASGRSRRNVVENEADEDTYGNDLQLPKTRTTKEMPCVLGELQQSLHTLMEVVDDAKPWFILCLRPNSNQLANQCEARMIRRQVHSIGISRLQHGHARDYSVTLTYTEFCDRYGVLPCFESLQLLGTPQSEAKMRVSDACALMNWTDAYVAMGFHKVFLCHEVFRELEDHLRLSDPEEVQYNLRKAAVDDEATVGIDQYSPYADLPPAEEQQPNPFEVKEQYAYPEFTFTGEQDRDEMQSLLHNDFESEKGWHDDESIMMNDALDAGPGDTGIADGPRVAEKLRVSTLRRYWVALTWLATWWIPSLILKRFKRFKRSDVRMAWREKVLINLIIWLICLASIFVIVFLGNVVCPKQHLYSTDELSGYTGKKAYTAIRGEVFNLNGIIEGHRAAIPVITSKTIQEYAGTDATGIFPVQVNALCNGVTGSLSPWLVLDNDNNTDSNAQYHDFRAYRTTDVRPDWYYEQMWYMRNQFRVGMIGYTPKDLDNMKQDGRTLAIYNRAIYDISDYVAQGNQGGVKVPDGMAPPANINRQILAPEIVNLMVQNTGQDITKQIDRLPLAQDQMDRQHVCLRNLFFIGQLDDRDSARCNFSKYILLGFSLLMVATVGFKFFAALQFGGTRPPQEQDKFVICQVPCYTEDTDSIRKTVNSLARLKYDDRRKLLILICDGNIVGAGNDAPTPQLVLELLGADLSKPAEPYSFVSLGEGSKQHNMARVYSGLYEHAGHMVPYLVVAKCGLPTETVKPGNRGKRDSQLVLMRFLNKVHFGLPMSPLELEMYHQIKNVIGVNPSFYEYILQVDADTEVEPTALTRMVATFVHDKKVIGLCGETALANEQQSLTTMLQVYEYYISHYMVKAFESLFGSITCLPGCFSMFRIRTPDTHRPLFVANKILEDYSENRVDTLHLKNLLYLGEDRYLTTLVLKYFPDYKTVFVRHAKCSTTAPDSWRILLSQRRRWINSTVHNLVELLRTPQLCGFCLFSMRFVVMIDLISTIIAPVTIGYLVYLVVDIAIEGGTIPLTSIMLLAAIYGLQVIIFLLHRRFDMIGWMVVYILALPIWSLVLPLYSFWHMDDFSWGNTRIVTGENGEKLVVHNEGTFDPAEIPQMTWEEYENHLWESRTGVSNPEVFVQNAPMSQSTQALLKRNPSLYGYASRPVPKYTDAKALHASYPITYSDIRHPYEASYDAQNQSWGMQDTSSMLHGDYEMGPLQAHQARPASYAPYAASTKRASSINHQDPYWPQEPVQELMEPSAMPMHPSNYTYEQAAAPVPAFRPASPAPIPAPATPAMGAEARRNVLPPDEVIRYDVRQLIAQSDLTTVTKRQIRNQLQAQYGCPIELKKSFINAQIEAALRDV